VVLTSGISATSQNDEGGDAGAHGCKTAPAVYSKISSTRIDIAMHIDGCEHTFDELATVILPGHLARLRDALRQPWRAEVFAQPNEGPSAIGRTLGLGGDFSGAYVLSEGSAPFYVGISRKVLARVRQHLVTNSHFSASLAYLMTCKSCQVDGKRAHRMRDPAFRSAFVERQAYLRRQSVAAVQIDNALELHLFETYAAMALETSQWNTFRTH
jgi:hypothetical protein